MVSGDAFTDQTRTCVECECDFVWTAGEQMFYADKGFKIGRAHV